MNPRHKNYLLLTLFITFLFLAFSLYNDLTSEVHPQPDSQSQIDRQNSAISAPDFIVYDRQEQEVKLSDFKGQPVVLNFWASWCSPCRQEMPHFNQIFTEAGDDVVFMMVNLVDGQRETKSKGINYVDEQKYVFPIYFDIEQTAAQAYAVSSIPTTLFIDRNGNIAKSYQGPISQNTLREGIKLIKG